MNKNNLAGIIGVAIAMLILIIAMVLVVRFTPSHEGTTTETLITEATTMEITEEVETTVATTEPVVITTSVVTTEPPKVTYFDVPLDESLQDYIFEVCASYDVDPALVVAIIKKESNFNDDAKGDSGRSLGLMQIQPRWHQARMDRLGCPDLLNPYNNVTVGTDILAELFRTGKSLEWVLMAYNGGTSYANKKVAAHQISDYASTVIRYMNGLKKERI